MGAIKVYLVAKHAMAKNQKAKAMAMAMAKAKSDRKLKARLARKSHQIICLCCQMLLGKASDSAAPAHPRQCPRRALLSILSTLNSDDVNNMP